VDTSSSEKGVPNFDAGGVLRWGLERGPYPVLVGPEKGRRIRWLYRASE